MEEQQVKTLISSKFDKILEDIQYTYLEKRELEAYIHKFTFGYRNKSYSFMIIRRLSKTVYHYQDNESGSGDVEYNINQKFQELVEALKI